MTPHELYEAGNLQAAIEAAVSEPLCDTACSRLLWALLCFAGQWERADERLESAGQQDPQAAEEVDRYRQLLCAEAARQQVFEQGRTPEFVGEPTPALRLHQDALICLRGGQAAEAARLLAQAAVQRPHVTGYCDGLEFVGFRDMDDLTAGFFEIFTPDGKYFWIPIEAVVSIEFPRPERPIDQLWRRAHVLLSGGSEAEVYLPALYPLTYRVDNDQLRLGRDTDWIGHEGEPVRGVGLRVFLVGDQDRTILAMDAVRFNTPV
jgi:type VI secretion system protein ImpE